MLNGYKATAGSFTLWCDVRLRTKGFHTQYNEHHCQVKVFLYGQWNKPTWAVYLFIHLSSMFHCLSGVRWLQAKWSVQMFLSQSMFPAPLGEPRGVPRQFNDFYFLNQSIKENCALFANTTLPKLWTKNSCAIYLFPLSSSYSNTQVLWTVLKAVPRRDRWWMHIALSHRHSE